jgi:hypothetical protein
MSACETARRHPNRSLSQAAALKEMYREEEKRMRQNLKSAFYGFSGAIVRKPYNHPVGGIALIVVYILRRLLWCSFVLVW